MVLVNENSKQSNMYLSTKKGKEISWSCDNNVTCLKTWDFCGLAFSKKAKICGVSIKKVSIN